jgi:hypothetical protein
VIADNTNQLVVVVTRECVGIDMSLARCFDCQNIIDTDDDPESTYAMESGFVCEWCRELRDKQKKNLRKEVK